MPTASIVQSVAKIATMIEEIVCLSYIDTGETQLPEPMGGRDVPLVHKICA
jgi:hypothetical protein